MFCDIFSKDSAKNLLKNKKILFFGSSNMRAIYKDLIWLLSRGNLAHQDAFRVKNEVSYLNDKRLSNDTLHNGKNYIETRLYKEDAYIFFHFLTRLYLDSFIKLIEEKKNEKKHPDVIIINSTTWDLTRWGSSVEAIKEFKSNIMKTFNLLRSTFPSTRIIWKTALPISLSANGAIFLDEISCIVPLIPWHINEANRYSSTAATFFNIDVLDLHHYMNFQGHLRVKDGIHWESVAVRYMTNCLLTHLSLCWNVKLPGNRPVNTKFIYETMGVKLNTDCVEKRVKKKENYFNKMDKKKEMKKPIVKAKNVVNKKKTMAKNVKRWVGNRPNQYCDVRFQFENRYYNFNYNFNYPTNQYNNHYRRM